MGMSLEKMITLFLGVVLFGALIGTVADSTIGINTTETNVTGATHTMTVIVPLIFAVVFIALMVKTVKK